MAAARKNAIPTEKLELYEKVLAVNPRIERKGDTVPYTSLNGHMFSYLNASGLMALRLAEPEREEFLKKYETTLFHAYGIIQKEYVTVPDSLLRNTDELRPWVDRSYRYVSAMKPKPTTKPAGKTARKATPKKSSKKASSKPKKTPRNARATRGPKR
jgi:TfoX/Sxy family transcriptional regulator of competence genes